MAIATVTIEPNTASTSPPQLPSDTTIQSGARTRAQTEVEDDVPSLAPTTSRPSLSWKSFRSGITLSEKMSVHIGWVAAFLSVLFTVVALSPAFKSQSMTERALELAEWTALKDFIEECREELAAGIESRACLEAMKTKIPPPPHVNSGVLDKMRRGLLTGHPEFNDTQQVLRAETHGVLASTATCELIVLAIFLAACILLLLRFKPDCTRSLRSPLANNAFEGAKEEASEPTAVIDSEPTILTTTVRHPPPENEASLRRRAVRTHPIYRHATLDEAIHAADLSEIRLRLQNGEDVNQHWPYLIYRLAISPKAPDMARRIEVARLCLDFGADVNAQKGWNGQSALLIAIHFGNVDIAKLLIANGAMVSYSAPDSQITAVHRCVRLATTGSSSDALEIMEMLFKYGAHADQMDRLNETPLHKLLVDSWHARHDHATFQKLFPIALCLVEHGARMPETIEDKFVIRNFFYDLVYAAIRERSKRIASSREFKRERQLWAGMDDARLSNFSRSHRQAG